MNNFCLQLLDSIPGLSEFRKLRCERAPLMIFKHNQGQRRKAPLSLRSTSGTMLLKTFFVIFMNSTLRSDAIHVQTSLLMPPFLSCLCLCWRWLGSSILLTTLYCTFCSCGCVCLLSVEAEHGRGLFEQGMDEHKGPQIRKLYIEVRNFLFEAPHSSR